MNIACSLSTPELQEPLPPVLVRIQVERDEDAAKIQALLEALGYAVTREGDDGLGEPGRASLERIAARIARIFRLNDSEKAVLVLALIGYSLEAIGRELGVSVQTARWRERVVLTKTNCENREALLRLAMFGRVVREPSQSVD